MISSFPRLCRSNEYGVERRVVIDLFQYGILDGLLSYCVAKI
jgi:hypothetical protein